MKRTVFLFSILWMVGLQAHGQTDPCESGYCPDTITVYHQAGLIAPVTTRIDYKVVESTLSGGTACWIAQNLGASAQASSLADGSTAARGWFWQFNLERGYAHDGTTRTPNTTWVTSINDNRDWLAENDPCTLFLGPGWHIPTKSDWVAVSGQWTSAAQYYTSELGLHYGGYLASSTGGVVDAGLKGKFWSTKQSGTATSGEAFELDFIQVNPVNKANAASLRCIRTYSW